MQLFLQTWTKNISIYETLPSHILTPPVHEIICIRMHRDKILNFKIVTIFDCQCIEVNIFESQISTRLISEILVLIIYYMQIYWKLIHRGMAVFFYKPITKCQSSPQHLNVTYHLFTAALVFWLAYILLYYLFALKWMIYSIAM